MTVSPDHVQVEYVRTYREVDLQVNGNGIFDGVETILLGATHDVLGGALKNELENYPM